jgi:hypothetical protein
MKAKPSNRFQVQGIFTYVLPNKILEQAENYFRVEAVKVEDLDIRVTVIAQKLRMFRDTFFHIHYSQKVTGV